MNYRDEDYADLQNNEPVVFLSAAMYDLLFSAGWDYNHHMTRLVSPDGSSSIFLPMTGCEGGQCKVSEEF